MITILLFIIAILLGVIVYVLKPEAISVLVGAAGIIVIVAIGLVIFAAAGFYLWYWYSNFDNALWWQHAIGGFLTLAGLGVIMEILGIE